MVSEYAEHAEGLGTQPEERWRMSREDEIVFLTEERIHAVLVNLGAYFSTVKYTRDGHEYEVQIGTDEIEFIEEWAHEHEWYD